SSQKGGGVWWIGRVGVDEKGPSQRQAALPAASDKSIEALRAVARDGVDGDIRVELVAEKLVAKADAEDGADEATYTLIVTAGSTREEHDGLTLKKGR